MVKVLDINNQVEQVVEDILKSNDYNFYVLVKNESGLLYITDIKEGRELQSKGYCYIHYSNILENRADSKEELHKMIKIGIEKYNQNIK